jgi:hypothetical protein
MRSIVNGLLVREGSVLLAKRAPLSDAIVGELREEIGITPTAFTEHAGVQSDHLSHVLHF